MLPCGADRRRRRQERTDSGGRPATRRAALRGLPRRAIGHEVGAAALPGRSVLEDLLGQRVQLQVGIRSGVQRPPEERLDDAVELLADARDLALGDARHVGLLHDGEQGALAAPSGFEQAAEER